MIIDKGNGENEKENKVFCWRRVSIESLRGKVAYIAPFIMANIHMEKQGRAWSFDQKCGFRAY